VTQPVFRFAPSPTGRLHLGHAYSALLNTDLAQRWAGRFLLRLEDIDVTRCHPEFEAGIYEDMTWLGLDWERPVRCQSEHFPEYHAAFQPLRRAGLAYPCFCSRAAIAEAVATRERETGKPWPRDPDGAPLYPATCRMLTARAVSERIAAGEPHAWRLAINAARASVGPDRTYVRVDLAGGETVVPTDPAQWGDVVIVRKEAPTSYHLSVVLDDALQGVTHVVRGADLEPATDLQVLLQALLGLPSPRYHHHALIRDDAGLKLSKSARSQSLATLRREGVAPSDVRRLLGFEA
jgi:glutamyl-Q tRNA(Asp) synthetase